MYEVRPNRIPWPPIIYVSAAIAGLFGHKIAPLGWSPILPVQILGWMLLTCALTMEVWAFLTFRKHKTNILPHKAANNLITGGPFSFSRNPIYLGNTLLLLGLAFANSNGWMLMMTVIAAIATQKLAIEREEIHMAAKFGKDWSNYTSQTRRWLGRN